MRNEFRWPDVVRVLQDAETRSYAVNALRDAGFSPDSFESQRKARETVAEALVRLEDQAELCRGSLAARRREAIRQIRRALELELWP
jgi:hypothetical protein